MIWRSSYNPASDLSETELCGYICEMATNLQGDELVDAINDIVLHRKGSPDVIERIRDMYNTHNNKYYAVPKMLFIAFISPDFMVQE